MVTMINPFESPESKESAGTIPFRVRLLLIASGHRGLFFGCLALGLTLGSFVLLIAFAVILLMTEDHDGFPGGERSFFLECLLFLTYYLSVVASIAAASAAIYGTCKELRLRDNLLAAGAALLGLAVSVPYCAWQVYSEVMFHLSP